jgi:hypothetical protein
LLRRVAPALTAGCLFQATGCTINAEGIAQGLLTAILNNLITSLVFGLFNIPVA